VEADEVTAPFTLALLKSRLGYAPSPFATLPLDPLGWLPERAKCHGFTKHKLIIHVHIINTSMIMSTRRDMVAMLV
jgi:hypothetical protein